MQTNGTQIVRVLAFMPYMILFFSFTGISQPDYDFSNSSKISGTDKQVGAKYRFTNVKTGVDAIVTISALTGGVTLNAVDGGSGFKEAFQPAIQVPANSKGYAEFTISFVLSGTTIPVVLPEVPITPIDVDGQQNASGDVFEFDQINWGLGVGSYVDYNMVGGELSIDYDADWITGTNNAAIDYPGIDTTARQAMFTVVVPSIPSIKVRVGGDNRSGSSVQRLRSIYFKKFTYPYSFLAKSALVAFSGREKDSKVQLQWELNSSNALSTIYIERASSPGNFSSIGELWLTGEAAPQHSFTFNDAKAIRGQAYYRLKMVAANGSVQYSNTLLFRSAEGQESFTVYPTLVQSSATVSVKVSQQGMALFRVVDYSGRLVLQKPVMVQEGLNTIQVNGLGNITAGNYMVLVITHDQQVYTRKIVKQ